MWRFVHFNLRLDMGAEESTEGRQDRRGYHMNSLDSLGEGWVGRDRCWVENPSPRLPGFCTLKSVKLSDGRAFSLGIALTRLSFNAFAANQENPIYIERKTYSQRLNEILTACYMVSINQTCSSYRTSSLPKALIRH